jgi:arabinoxylan arabinofuranohydrolase
MVSDDPTNPDSWVYKGEYGAHTSAPNNHSHLHKFQGNYYYLYHDHSLMDAMKSKGAAGSNSSLYRSICVNKATVNEETATINKVTLNLTGVTKIKNLDPYELQQAETMATSGGIEYEHFTNITPKTSLNKLGNEASENLQVQMKAGSWIQLRNVDFGTTGAAKLMLRAKGEGTFEIRLGSKTATAAATVDISSADMNDYSFDIDATLFQGVKTVYIVATAATDLYLDAWQYTEADPSGIQTLESSKALKTQRYDLSGRNLSGAQQHHGIVIEQYTDENGVKHSRKVVSGKE